MSTALNRHLRWINPKARRYYTATLERDLFEQWTLRTVWGGLDSRLGGMRVTAVASLEEGMDALERLAKRRRRRGYERVT